MMRPPLNAQFSNYDITHTNVMHGKDRKNRASSPDAKTWYLSSMKLGRLVEILEHLSHAADRGSP